MTSLYVCRIKCHAKIDACGVSLGTSSIPFLFPFRLLKPPMRPQVCGGSSYPNVAIHGQDNLKFRYGSVATVKTLVRWDDNQVCRGTHNLVFKWEVPFELEQRVSAGRRSVSPTPFAVLPLCFLPAELPPCCRC